MNKLIYLVSTFIFCFNLYAIEVNINISSSFEPVKAIGFVFNNKKSIEILNTKLSKVNDHSFLVQFGIKEQKKLESFVGAAIYSKDGKVEYSNISNTKNTYSNNLNTLPTCLSKKYDFRRLNKEHDYSELQKLVVVRANRRKKLKERIEKILGENGLETLKFYEKLFGTNYNNELNLELNPLELTKRIYAIKESLKIATKIQNQNK